MTTPHPRPAPADDTRDVNHIIDLINYGVDFGSMSTIRTLVDEIKHLRDYVAGLEADNQSCFDELEKAMKVIREHAPQPPPNPHA